MKFCTNDSRNSSLSLLLAVVFLLVALIGTPTLAQTTPTFTQGQTVEVREGDTWSKATFLNKEGRRYQIKYEGTGDEEWVTIDRLRATSSTSEIPGKTAHKNTYTNADFEVNQKIEVKWGGTWREASIVRKQGLWTLVQFENTPFREWIEPYRLRKLGSTIDKIGYAPPNPVIHGSDRQGPPRETVGEAPKPLGYSEEVAEAADKLKEDPAYKPLALVGESIPLMASQGWQVIPDSLISPKLFPQTVTLRGSQGLRDLRQHSLFLARDVPLALIGHVTGAGRKELTIEKVDLSARASIGVYTIGSEKTLQGVSPDGSLALVSSDDRLEIWSLQSSTASILHILLPYDHLQLHARQVAFASLIDSNHLLTYNSEGLAVLWDLASGNSLYQCQFNPHSKPTLSPSGTYLVLEQGKVAVLLETLTGKVFGELDLDGLTSATYSISDSGNQLLAYTGGHMRLYDLTNGQFISESSMNESSGSLFLPRDGLALLNDTHLIDLNKHVSLNIAQDSSSRAGVGKAGMLFSILTDTTHKTLALRGIAVPTDSMLADLAALNPDELVVLKPGVKVRLSINISGDEPQRQKAIDALKRNIADAGLILDDAAPLTFTALTEQGKSHEIQYSSFRSPAFGPKQTATVTEQKAILKLELNGQVLWSRSSTVIPGMGMVSLKENQTLEQYIAQASKPNLSLFSSTRIPRYLAKDN